MFFEISSNTNSNYPNHHFIKDKILNCDDGWIKIEKNNIIYFYKGYYESNDTLDCILDANVFNIFGNFILISFGESIEIKHSYHRSFPLYYSEYSNVVTNLKNDKMKFVDIDKFISISDKINLIKINQSYELIIPEDFDNKINLLISIIVNKVNFLKKEQNIKLYLSGGVDTALIHSLLINQKIEFEFILGEHFEYNYFFCKNYSVLKNYWSYSKQIHNFNYDCFLVSGVLGDEVFLRSPYEFALFCYSRNLSTLNLLDENDHHFLYFKREPAIKTFTNIQRNKHIFKDIVFNKDKFLNHLIQYSLTDYQHWHFGKTLTVTPFLDERILKIMYSFDDELIFKQLKDSFISKLIIERLNKESLKYISKYKNDNSFENLVSLL